MKKNLFVVINILIVSVSAAPPSDLPKITSQIFPEGRIIGGENTNITEAPYQVSIQLLGSHFCGGSIINKEWILTAGHCAGKPLFYYKIRIGSDISTSGGNIYSVSGIYQHEDFISNPRGVPLHDIALLRLSKPIEENEKQRPVTLFSKDENVEAGSLAIITGWGRTKYGTPEILQTVSVPVIDKVDCYKAYKKLFGGIEINQICAAYPEGGKDACQGDSGGPLTIGGRQAGIVSWGNGCALKGYPGVYTEVSKYHDWIVKITNLELDLYRIYDTENIKHITRVNMFAQLTIVCLIAVAAADPIPRQLTLNPYTPNGRIVGGEDVDIEEVPYQVSLQAYGFGFCGGSIIAKDWVLTAGHCIIYSADSMVVRAGTTTKSSGGSQHKVAEIIRHENYRTNMNGIPENDVALLRLATPFELDAKRQPISLFDINEESVPGVKATITGWGAVFQGGSTTENLKIVNIPMVSKVDCNEAYSSFGGVPAGQICAAYPQGGKDACQGDSGGPLAIEGRLAGIVSWGNGCAKKGYPGVYTEVAAFRDWIDSKLKP
ncbi:PREDICTED: transmembrane protease serine 9-like [Polistes canadensis]|uniref:transmembrane protease serine 9-like n=1 Tax=Polistes canadensis TaxID=91411 RepID=UPI000718B06D|nr:PREDICTED: transmembrane protease serine 9-like [Polistes canadensis]